jgi:hypothetical protein
MFMQRSETDAILYKLFWGEHRPSVANRLREAELFSGKTSGRALRGKPGLREAGRAGKMRGL